MISYDKSKIKESLSTENIFDLLVEWGGDPEYADFGILSATICHNLPGDGSRKLYYYENSTLFKCYTGCDSTFDIFELTIKVFNIQHNKELDLEEEYYDKMKELEPEFAKLTCQLVYKLTGILAEQKQDVIIYIMNRTLREIENSKNFLIKVSEEDYEVVMNRVNEIYGKSNPSISIDILAESKLSKNQCLIETDNGIVDASLEVQLEGLIEDIMLISGV